MKYSSTESRTVALLLAANDIPWSRLASALQVTPSWVSRRMRGQQAWRRADLLAVSKVIGIKVEVLETGAVPEFAPEITLTIRHPLKLTI